MGVEARSPMTQDLPSPPLSPPTPGTGVHPRQLVKLVHFHSLSLLNSLLLHTEKQARAAAMKYGQSLLLALAASGSLASAGLFTRDVPAWHDWDNSQLERWLTDHKVPNPGKLSTEQLRDLVKANYDKAYDKW